MAFCKIINLQDVENEESWVKDPDNEYIGRGTDILPSSQWGNPFKIDENNDREQVVAKYDQYLRNNKDLCRQIVKLKGKTLGCHCIPLPCHGEVIQRLGEELLASDIDTSAQGSAVALSVDGTSLDGAVPMTPVVALTFPNASIPVNVKNTTVENGSSSIPQNTNFSPSMDAASSVPVTDLPLALSPGSHLINVISDAISNDSIIDSSSHPTKEECSIQEKMGVSTKETMISYSTIVKSPDSPPVHQSQLLVQIGSAVSSPSDSPKIGDVCTPNCTEGSRQDSNDLHEVPSVNDSPSYLSKITSTSSESLKESKRSNSLPNLTPTNSEDKDQEYEIDPQALNALMWIMSQKMEDFAKRIQLVSSKIDNVENYFTNFVTHKLSSFETKIQSTVTDNAENCERARIIMNSALLEKVDDAIKENEVMRNQWKIHMDRMKINLRIMEETAIDEDDDEEESVVEPELVVDDIEGHRVPYDVNSSTYARTRPVIPNDETEEKIAKLENEVKNLNKKLFGLDCRVVECEQYSRRESLVITGIPEEIKDVVALENTVISVLEKLGIFIEVKDISACHRLGKFQRNSRFPRRVIVKFINRQIVYGALNNREKLWDLRGDLQMNLRFYESLCSLNQEALRICKGLQEEGLIHSYYIWHGFVNIVVKDGDKPFKIKHPEVLREKFNQTPE